MRMDADDSVFYVLESGSVYAGSSPKGPFSYRSQQLPEHALSASMPGTSLVFFADSSGDLFQSDAWGEPTSFGSRRFEHLRDLHAWNNVLYVNDGALSRFDKGSWTSMFQLPVDAIQAKMHDSVLWFQHSDSVTIVELQSGKQRSRQLPSADHRVLDATVSTVASITDSTLTIQSDTSSWSVSLEGVHHDSDAAIQWPYLMFKGKPSSTGLSIVYSLNLLSQEFTRLSTLFEHGGVVRTAGTNTVVVSADSCVIRSYAVTANGLTRTYSQTNQYFNTWAVYPKTDTTCVLVVLTTMPESVNQVLTFGFVACTLQLGDRFVRNLNIFPSVQVTEIIQWTGYRSDSTLVCVSGKRIVEFAPNGLSRQLYATTGTIITGAIVNDTVCVSTLDGEFKVVSVDSLRLFHAHEQDEFFTIGMASLGDTILLLQSKFAQQPIRRLFAFAGGAVWPVSYPASLHPAMLRVHNGRVLLIESNLAPPITQSLFERGSISQRTFVSEQSTRLDEKSLQSCNDVSSGFLATVSPFAVVNMVQGMDAEVWEPPLSEEQPAFRVLYSVVLDSTTVLAIGSSEYTTFQIRRTTSAEQPTKALSNTPGIHCQNGSIFVDEALTQQPSIQCATLDGRTFTFVVPPSGLPTSFLPNPSCFIRLVNSAGSSSYFFANEHLYSVGFHR